MGRSSLAARVAGTLLRTVQRAPHFFSMFHIGGTDGTDRTPAMRSDR
jgi:hypothetical protein